MLRLVPFDKSYLVKSYDWLNDPEIQALTDGPQCVTCKEQEKWFLYIQNDSSYQIWGIEYEGTAIGACGIKHIDFEKKIGEYWGYIGEKEYWGGKGRYIFNHIYTKAKLLGLKELKLNVLKSNLRAYSLYIKEGFKVQQETDNKFLMYKYL